MQYEIENETFRAKGFVWLVRKAISLKYAQQAVLNALATNSKGALIRWNGEIVADVIKVNE